MYRQTIPTTARAAIIALIKALQTGDITACRHLPSSTSPAYWAMWARTVMVCRACLPMLALTGEEDSRCDHCREIVPMIHLEQAGTEGLVILHGACPGCEGIPEMRTA